MTLMEVLGPYTNYIKAVLFAMYFILPNEQTSTENVPHGHEGGLGPLHSAAAVVFEQTIMITLEGLNNVIEEEASPTQEETNTYLEKVALIKKRNSETAMLNLLDELIDMSIGGKIGQAELDNVIPDNILVTFRYHFLRNRHKFMFTILFTCKLLLLTELQ